jgi:ribosomal protein S18 acetylase RimI-like enzyme
MKKASYGDKQKFIEILSESFRDNKSVNYIIKQDKYSVQRINKLIAYSFDLCYLYGEAWLSDNEDACALIMLPDKKKSSLKSVLLDMKLILSATGFSNALKAMQREAEIKKHHPPGNIYYLWFIGVTPVKQNNGTGTLLLIELINRSKELNRTVYLETSVGRNISWYQKHGFDVYEELDFGYTLFCMKSK